MELSAKIDYSAFAEAFNKVPLIAERELKKAMIATTKAIGTDARLHHRFKRKSGNLQKSVHEEISNNGLSGKVFLDEGTASYGKYVHDGTGIFNGKSAYPVVPKNKKALYWKNASGKHFSKGVMIQGIKPDQFLYQAAARQEPKFIERINSAIKRIIEAAGLK